VYHLSTLSKTILRKEETIRCTSSKTNSTRILLAAQVLKALALGTYDYALIVV